MRIKEKNLVCVYTRDRECGTLMSVQRISCAARLTQSRGGWEVMLPRLEQSGLRCARVWSVVGDAVGEESHDEAGVTRTMLVPVPIGSSRPELSRSLLAVGKANREKPLGVSCARRTSMLCQRRE